MKEQKTADDFSAWCEGTWISEGPCVAVLEGQAGIGKTRLVKKFALAHAGRAAYVRARGDVLAFDDLLLEVAVELDAFEGGAGAFQDLELDLSSALIDTLRRQPYIVIIDDFDAFLDPATGTPPPAVLKLLHQLVDRPTWPGRLLLVTRESFPAGEWLEGLSYTMLLPPKEIDAVLLLGELLDTTDRSSQVPEERRLDVVRWLGCNPRALQIFVSCLAWDTLDELIGLEPESWEVRDQVVSPNLVAKLEQILLERTLARLDPVALLLLEYISVYRRPFIKDAIIRLRSIASDIDVVRTALESKFLIESQGGGWYAVNPIARQIAWKRVQRKPKTLALAHGNAANHYARHFRGIAGRSQTVQRGVIKHAAEFAEARFHLVRSDRESEFETIAAELRTHLRMTSGVGNRIPDGDRDQRELTLALAAALDHDDRGHSDLRFLLARLFLLRQRPGDDLLALRQLRLAIVESGDPAVWVLYIRLIGKHEGPVAVLAVIDQASEKLNQASMGPVQVAVAKTLTAVGRADDAIRVLARAVDTGVSPGYLFAVYQLWSGLQTRRGQYADAVTTLERGLQDLGPSGKNLHRLIETGLYLGFSRRDLKSIKYFQDWIYRREPQDPRVVMLGVSLGECLILQGQGRYLEAAEKFGDISGYVALTVQVAFCWLVVGELERAQAALEGIDLTTPSVAWLSGVIALRRSRHELANVAFEQHLRRPLTPAEAADPNLWLRLWDHVPAVPEVCLSHYIPRLPAALTGLNYELSRLPDQPSVFASGKLAHTLDSIRSGPVDASEPVGTESAETVAAGPVINIQVAPNIGSIDVGNKEISMSDTYNVGNAGAVGKNATASHFSIGGQSPTAPELLPQLAEELARLRQEMKSKAVQVDEDMAVVEIGQAEKAAAEGNVVEVQSHLKRAGAWALATATSLGVAVAAAAIKAATGL